MDNITYQLLPRSKVAWQAPSDIMTLNYSLDNAFLSLSLSLHYLEALSLLLEMGLSIIAHASSMTGSSYSLVTS